MRTGDNSAYASHAERGSSPKDKTTGSTKRLNDWSLNDFINVAHETGYLGLDVKKHWHALRNFRNYIHPNAQVIQQFTPDEYTAILGWQVLKAALCDIHSNLNRKS